MTVRLTNSRSKSTSDILDEITDKEKLEESIDNRYRTYTLKDMKKEKKCFAEKEQTAQKSQSFVKKLIASLEKKNEACKADDEFFTKYYRRNEYSNPNSDYSPLKNNDLDKVKRIENREDSRVKWNERFSRNCRNEENFKSEEFAKNKMLVLPKNVTGRRSLSENYDDDNNLGLNVQRDARYYGASCVHLHRKLALRRETDTNENNEEEDRYGSSFDPSRSRIELENRIVTPNSSFLLKNKDDRKKSTLERLLTRSKKEENTKKKTFNGNSRGKLSRSKSFKDFFGSMMKWKKTENEKKPRRFVSCDHLVEGSMTFDIGNSQLITRSSSFQAVVFQDRDEENLLRERKATIRPIYGGKRNEQRWGTFVKETAAEKLFAIENNIDDLVKPSAVRDIAKSLSQLPHGSTINDHLGERRRLPIKRNY